MIEPQGRLRSRQTVQQTMLGQDRMKLRNMDTQNTVWIRSIGTMHVHSNQEILQGRYNLNQSNLCSKLVSGAA